MLNLPIFVGLDYHSKMIQVCVMNQKRKILVSTSVENDPEAVFRVVCLFGTNDHCCQKKKERVTAVTKRWIRKMYRLVFRYHPHWSLHSLYSLRSRPPFIDIDSNASDLKTLSADEIRQ